MSAGRPLAAIDVGTNSIHLVVARPLATGAPEILAREKAPVRLGEGGTVLSKGDDMKRLSPEAVNRAVDALGRFRLIAEAHDAEVVAVATSAVREAEDQDRFIERAREEAGVHVEVVSGVEEARLIHLGALGAVPIADRRHLVIDIGGGSTELVVGDGTQPILARSLKLGHIRLTDRFFPDGIVADGSVKACRRHVRAFLAPVAREVNELEAEVVVGCSGTIENLARMAAAREHGEPKPVDNLVLSRAGLDDVVADLVGRHRPRDRRDLAGLDEGRSDVIIGGAVLLRQLFRSLEIDELVVSSAALREGLLLDRIRRRDSRGDALHHLGDLRGSSVLAVARRYEEDLEHAEHSTDLALGLFDETIDLHGLDEPDRDLLEAAGLLHNIGRFIAHAAHHKHSYYLIRNSEHLAGFTDHEIELIAQIARYHRKSHPKRKHPEFASLTDHDQQRVRVLAGMLRVGIGLDRTYRRSVERVTVESTRKRLLLRLATDADADVELELFTARERSALLAEALGREIELRLVEEHP
jgi:exopolyphosphatase/guanosine-5'-triphosphate,3'-diphosphate pyrophosphatase